MKIINRWQADAENHTINSAIIMLLATMIVIFFPSAFLEELIGSLTALSIIRLVASIIGIVFMLMYGISPNFRDLKSIVKSLDIIILALILTLTNFPFFALANGEAVFKEGSNVVWHIIFCISVGLFEEIFFRGLIFSLLLIRFKKHFLGELLAITISSVMFGLVHLVNLTGGAGLGAVMLQVGYSTLIGALCATVYLFCRNLSIPIILHAVFNLGGLLIANEIITGKIWNPPAIILMTVVSVLTLGYFIFRFILRQKGKSI